MTKIFAENRETILLFSKDSILFMKFNELGRSRTRKVFVYLKNVKITYKKHLHEVFESIHTSARPHNEDIKIERYASHFVCNTIKKFCIPLAIICIPVNIFLPVLRSVIFLGYLKEVSSKKSLPSQQ
ncbi:hypothetical protein ALC53_05904 [Atta colombica]|uniref:Uncharacterized protein n=1 Tax=Atta colombica TaxID=520822 RepID=A0A195BH73_9HYME|nr:hypothetical protein ALC53_05904 [Atta colombica]